MTAQLKLKSYSCTSIDNLPKWRPRSAADVHFTLDLERGERSSEGGNLFYVTVMTPEALAAKRSASSIVLEDRALIVISEFKWPELFDHIHTIIKSCQASSWERSVEKLVRYFEWEYEDYVR